MAAKKIRKLSIEPSTCTLKSINNVNSLHVMKKKSVVTCRNRKTVPQALLAMFEFSVIFGVSWKYTHNT
jgi:hypothetical protein